MNSQVVKNIMMLPEKKVAVLVLAFEKCIHSFSPCIPASQDRKISGGWEDHVQLLHPGLLKLVVFGLNDFYLILNK